MRHDLIVRDNAVYLAAAWWAINQNSLRRGFLALLALLGGYFTTSARAEISGNGAPPAGAVPAEIHVARGGSLGIPLRTFGPTLSVKYLIRTGPRFGKLSTLRVQRNGEGTIIYQHSGEKTSDRDRFTYAAQTWRGVSVAATVDIIIDDTPAVLSAAGTLAFGDVPLGTSKTLPLSLTNRGGSDATGFLRTAAPWQADGGALYRIPSGGEREVTVTFTPSYLGPVEGALNYSSSNALVTTLQGRGTVPFAVTPATVAIRAAPPRRALVTVRNDLDQPVTLHVKAPAPFVVPATLDVPAGGSAELALSVPAAQVEPAEGVLDVFSDAFAAHAAISADAVFPHLEIAATTLAAAPTKIGATSFTPLAIKNTGLRAARVNVTANAPFSLGEPDRAFTLEPNATRLLEVRFTPTATAAVASTLLIAAETQQLSVECRGDGVPVPVTARLLAQRQTTPEMIAAEEPKREPLSKVPAITELRATKVHRTAVQLSWPLVPDRDLTYEVQRRVLYLDKNRQLHAEWQPITGAQINVSGAQASTWITRLPARSFLIARVISRDSLKAASAPSPELRVQTTGFPWPSWTQWLFLVLFVLLGLIGYGRWQERRAVARL